MKKTTLALLFLFLPSLAFAGGWFKDVGDKVGRGLISDATGIDVTKQQGEQEAANNNQGGLQQGAAVLECGCYGNTQAGITRQNPQCASGFDLVMLCRGRCPRGGNPWGAVCQ